VKEQKTADVLREIGRQGWVFLRDGQGSHEIWGLAGTVKKVSIPAGHRTTSAGVLRQLERAGIEIPKAWK